MELAVIPAAGAGTRLRPFTRTIAKPLLPILDKPLVQYVVEEAVDAGLTEIVFVVGPDRAVLDHFTTGEPIEGLEHVSFSAVEQVEPRGLGNAVSCAKWAVGGRPFAVLLSDMFPVPGRGYLVDMMQVGADNVIAVQRVDEALLDAWGVVARATEGKVFRLAGAIEKPGRGAAPSDLGIVGRYLFSSEVFDVLESLEPGWGDEIQLTDAINVLATRSEVFGFTVDHPLLDAGNPMGIAKATVEVALRRPELRDQFQDFLSEIRFRQE
jgi:UTP--glucose-1-phosphate uridylyltransferase